MPVTKNIPQVQYNTTFGNIGKVVWFDVSNDFNYFDLFFEIKLQQAKKTSLSLYNNSGRQIVWTNLYPSDANQETFLDSIKILSIASGVDEQPYGVINNPT